MARDTGRWSRFACYHAIRYETLSCMNHLDCSASPSPSCTSRNWAPSCPRESMACHPVFLRLNPHPPHSPQANETLPALHCSRPFCPKLEIQHDRRGRGVPTLTGEEVTVQRKKRWCCRYKKLNYELKTKCKSDLQSANKEHAYHVGFCTIPYICHRPWHCGGKHILLNVAIC